MGEDDHGRGGAWLRPGVPSLFHALRGARANPGQGAIPIASTGPPAEPREYRRGKPVFNLGEPQKPPPGCTTCGQSNP